MLLRPAAEALSDFPTGTLTRRRSLTGAMNTVSKRVPRRRPIPQLELVIEGFKSFRDRTEIPLRPLTVFSGSNSSGKSSAIQPLLLLKQTLEAPFDPGPVRLDGPIVKFTESKQLIWRLGKGKASDTFTIGLAGEESTITSTFRVATSGGISLDSTKYRSSAAAFEISRASHSAELREIALQTRNEPHSGFFIAQVFSDNPGMVFRPVENRFSYTIGLENRRPDGRTDFIATAFDPWEVFNGTILDIIHVEGLRGNPERAYPLIPAPSRFEGSFRREYVAGLLWSWQQSKDSKIERLSGYLRDLGLTWKVQLRKVSEVAVELRVGRSPAPRRGGAQDLVNIADVGFGVSQVLPILVALLSARRGQLVFIEQPELHLHPRAQVALGRILAEAARRGVLIVIETHSQLLLRAIQTMVAEQELPSSLVGLHWFSRDEEGQTHVRPGSLDRFGSYGDWPEDFADVQLDLEERFLDAPYSSQ